MQTRSAYRQSVLHLVSKNTCATLRVYCWSLFLLSTMSTLLSACSSGDPQAQQQANQNRASLDQTLHYAQTIGTPVTDLKPVLIKSDQSKQRRLLSHFLTVQR